MVEAVAAHKAVLPMVGMAVQAVVLDGLVLVVLEIHLLFLLLKEIMEEMAFQELLLLVVVVLEVQELILQHLEQMMVVLVDLG